MLSFNWALVVLVNIQKSNDIVAARKRRGKVIFSQACVKNSVHGGRGGGIPACLAGFQAPHPGGCLGGSGQGGLQAHTWGVPGPGGSAPRGLPGPGWGEVGCGDPPGTATAAGGTHPTGMHSCLYQFCPHEGWNLKWDRSLCDRSH